MIGKNQRNTSVWWKILGKNKMAAPKPLVEIGDFVKTGERVCFVESIENKIGFNTYILVDIDSGVTLRKARFEFDPIEVEYVSESEMAQFIEENEVKQPKKEEKRFETLSNEELDQLAQNRISKNTKKQTSWGVSIFKGETLVYMPFKFAAILRKK
jgi:hypothetical protein